jgi:hypothetical protein
VGKKGERELFLFLPGVGVEVDPGRDDDAQDKDKEHDLIEVCPPAQHSASLSLQPVRIHYNTLRKVKKHSTKGEKSG